MNTAAESANEFWVEFNSQVEKLRAAISHPPAEDTQDYVLRVKTTITELQNYATISTITLPAYDIKRSQDAIESVSREIKALDAKLHPRKKFKFSARAKATTTAPGAEDGTPTENAAGAQPNQSANAETAPAPSDSVTAGMRMASLLPPGAFVLTQRTGETIHVSAEMLRANIPLQAGKTTTAHSSSTSGHAAPEIRAQLFIKDVSGCKITVPSLLGSVRIEQTSHCDISLGACCTSVYLEGVTDCTIQILSHQLRIHQCTGCRLYVRVQSHPIIEDCSDMGFAPYSYTYDTLPEDIHVAGLQAAAHWNTVVDFRWHKSTASPNWFEIPARMLAGAGVGAAQGGGDVPATVVSTEADALPVPSETAGKGSAPPPPVEDDDEF